MSISFHFMQTLHLKLVCAPSHPIACSTVNLKLDKHDAIEGQIHEFWNRRRVKSEADSSETETDSETEMTVIKPKTNKMVRLGSHSSYG